MQILGYFGLLLSRVSLGLQVVTVAACKMVITDPCLRVSTPCGIPFPLAWAELKNSFPMNRTGQISEVSALRLGYLKKKKKDQKACGFHWGCHFLFFLEEGSCHKVALLRGWDDKCLKSATITWASFRWFWEDYSPGWRLNGNLRRFFDPEPPNTIY